ncbi:hypothetical protein K443DRAFT_127928 [Laccaria amethystina LaAM-08-1]|uniref:J domain-containing protein n=1 Tax=Laccaria amethystina LaAM-08-1 TaxID=1095629 RepID=A0A0C9YLQ0_9AGAR|nr:hypothetical protein K443DRAFT_127928 [Laccaria amethystina LaAM-08-1]
MPPSSFKNFYDILGVDRRASTDDATEEGKQAAEIQFHKVREAFETLCDPEKRRAYDTRLSMKADPQRVSEEFVRRTTERREWARKQQEEVQKRTDAFQEKIRREREAKELAKARELEEAAMAADILKDMYQHTPGLMERREAALRVRSSFQIFYQIRPSRFPSERPSANVQSVAAVDNSSDRNVR